MESFLHPQAILFSLVRVTSKLWGEVQCCLCDACVYIRFGEERPTRLPDLATSEATEVAPASRDRLQGQRKSHHK